VKFVPWQRKRGKRMLDVTEGAQKMLTQYMKEQNLSSPLRIYLASGG